jgi:hypothetical protein
MKSFKSIEIDEDVIQEMETDFPEGAKLLSITPSRSSSMNKMEELLHTLHTVKTSSKFLRGTRNVSETCGLEIWYNGEKFEFVFFVPNEEQERHYRKQLVGHFDDIGIEEKVEDEFLPFEKGEYITGARFHLKNHFFEPVEHSSFTHSDPYQPILSEIDSRDGTRAMIQILFKPARSGWTSTFDKSVSSYAEEIRNGQRWTTKFGIPMKEDYPSSYKKVADAIESQNGKPAFHVNIRFMIGSGDKEKLEEQARNVEHQYEKEFERINGQTFDPQPIGEKSKLIEVLDLMSGRREHTMKPLKGVRMGIREKLQKVPWIGRLYSDIDKTRMIMTIPELAAACHLPDPGMLDTIDGAGDELQTGTIPEGAADYEPVSEGDNNGDN